MKMIIKIEHNSPAPVYIQIKQQIKNYIQLNNLSGGSRIPSIKTISQSAGVSLRTVERGLAELINENICYRRPKTGTFVSDTLGLPQKRHVCGILHALGEAVIGNITHDEAMLAGVREKSEKNDTTTLFISNKTPESDISFFMQNSGIDFEGLIVFDVKGFEKAIDLAKKFPNLKIICLNYSYRNFQETPPNLYGVFNDDFAGAYQMTEYLISRGHRQIGFLSLKIADENYRDRLKGYRRALEDNRLKYDEGLVVEFPNNQQVANNIERGNIGGSKLLAANPRMSAIFAVNDRLAEGALGYLKSEGVDNKIIITGHDNMHPEISRDNNFSTVSVDFRGMGAKAVEILVNSNKPHSKVIRIAPQLVIRECDKANGNNFQSCNCLKSGS
jgi:DNA-binding LacI/PurR family transcriptional regulator